jgi:hypothetical protein
VRLLKQSTARDIDVFMALSSDGKTGALGKTLTVEAGKNGGAFATITPTVTERAYGWYTLTLTTAHVNTLGDLKFHITAASCDPSDFVCQVVADLPGATVASVTGNVGGNVVGSVNSVNNAVAVQSVLQTELVVCYGDVTASTSTTVTFAYNASSRQTVPAALVGCMVTVYTDAGDGARVGQPCVVTAATLSGSDVVLTVDPPWTDPPTAGNPDGVAVWAFAPSAERIAAVWGSRSLGNGRTADMFLQGLTNRIDFAADGLSGTLYATDDTTALVTFTATRLGDSVGGLRSLNPAGGG